jgi:hypothetical protein
MALKKLRVSFDIDIPVFLQMVAAGNCAMKIDVFGDGTHAKPPKQPKHLNGHSPKLLEGPKRKSRNVGGMSNYSAILAVLAQNKDRAVKVDELQQAVVANGGQAKSTSPQIAKLRTDGLVKRTDGGAYQVTARGLAHHAKTTAQKTEEA